MAAEGRHSTQTTCLGVHTSPVHSVLPEVRIWLQYSSSDRSFLSLELSYLLRLYPDVYHCESLKVSKCRPRKLGFRAEFVILDAEYCVLLVRFDIVVLGVSWCAARARFRARAC